MIKTYTSQMYDANENSMNGASDNDTLISNTYQVAQVR